MIGQNPKISIITINYNNKNGLKRTIDSVINQSFKDIEYIVIDGGSDDGSKAILEQYRQLISYSVSEPDKGIYNAMNKGISKSTGEYLLFLNSGDTLLNERIIDEIEAELNQDLVYGDLLFFDENREWFWNLPSELSFNYFYKFSIAHPSTFIKRSLFDKVGLYDEDLKIVSDWKFFLIALAKFNCSYKHLPVVISKYSFDGLSSKPENLTAIEQERMLVLNKEFPFFVNDYKKLDQLAYEIKRIGYFMKTRKFIKKIFNQK